MCLKAKHPFGTCVTCKLAVGEPRAETAGVCQGRPKSSGACYNMETVSLIVRTTYSKSAGGSAL